MSIPLIMSDVAAYHVFQRNLINDKPPCTGNNAHSNIWYAATSLITKEYS
jgi:hypothetical protein